MSGLLEIDKLSVRFGASTVVDQVSFAIAAGEKFALVGESGSGKSVTAMAIVNLLPDNAERAGCILYRGHDLLKADAAHLRALRHAVHLAHAKGDVQVLDRQQQLAHSKPRSLGSSASRSASVSSENAVTKLAMNSVAAASCHQWPSSSSLCASASIVPQLTWSTGTPRPR